jgi:hypothetical protein
VKWLAADRNRWRSFVKALCSYTADNRNWWWCFVLVSWYLWIFFFSVLKSTNEDLAADLIYLRYSKYVKREKKKK